MTTKNAYSASIEKMWSDWDEPPLPLPSGPLMGSGRLRPATSQARLRAPATTATAKRGASGSPRPSSPAASSTFLTGTDDQHPMLTTSASEHVLGTKERAARGQGIGFRGYASNRAEALKQRSERCAVLSRQLRVHVRERQARPAAQCARELALLIAQSNGGGREDDDCLCALLKLLARLHLLSDEPEEALGAATAALRVAPDQHAHWAKSRALKRCASASGGGGVGGDIDGDGSGESVRHFKGAAEAMLAAYEMGMPGDEAAWVTILNALQRTRPAFHSRVSPKDRPASGARRAGWYGRGDMGADPPFAASPYRPDGSRLTPLPRAGAASSKVFGGAAQLRAAAALAGAAEAAPLSAVLRAATTPALRGKLQQDPMASAEERIDLVDFDASDAEADGSARGSQDGGSSFGRTAAAPGAAPEESPVNSRARGR